ncbi:phycobilisome linker polypeptide [Myxosarcina sp. GI1(2024)]
MLGNYLVGGRSNSPAKNRVFVYEVKGLKQGDENESKNNYPLRTSSNVFMRVPYNRMNEEMQRISKMGGTIVNIQPLDSFKMPSKVNQRGTEEAKE